MMLGTKADLRRHRALNAIFDVRFVLALISAFVWLSSVVAVAVEQPEPQGAPKAGTPVDFDVPAQTLSKALYAFSSATGIEILVDARHAVGRQSTGIKGFLKPRDALKMLLAGSGLVAQEFGPDTVTLKVDTSTPSGRMSGIPSGGEPPYFVAVQRAVQQALCNDARTSPGHYRIALKLWIGTEGAVLRSKRLDTTGDESLDAALDAAVQVTKIGASPPSDLPQPFTLVISPRQAPGGCPSGASDLRRASTQGQ